MQSVPYPIPLLSPHLLIADMAATATMDVDRNCHGIRGTPLRINRASGKIAKKAMGAASRPADRVYNTDPSSFRKLVQELTGLEIEPSAAPPTPPGQSEKPVLNGRLQKIAPPPLSSDAVLQCGDEGCLKLSPLPLISPGLLSPISAFTPMEWMPWSDETAASPASLAYKQLAQTLLDREAKFEDLQDSYLRSPTQPHAERTSKYGTAVGARLPLSPTTCSLNLPSPGSLAGFEFGPFWGLD